MLQTRVLKDLYVTFNRINKLSDLWVIQCIKFITLQQEHGTSARRRGSDVHVQWRGVAEPRPEADQLRGEAASCAGRQKQLRLEEG